MTETPIRVLVVEDEPIAAAAHAEYVRRLNGFEVAGVAHTAAEALSALGLARSSPDGREGMLPELVLLDMNLPDLHGLDVLRRIRGTGLPVGIIAVTAVRELPVVQQAISAGIAQYLIKPFTFAAFAEKLEQYREFRDSLRQQASATTQGEVDKTLAALRPSGPTRLPKGLSEETLRRVVELLQGSPDPVSATEVTEILGISRVTARRYLEHLAEHRSVARMPRYGTPGRPEFEYSWRR